MNAGWHETPLSTGALRRWLERQDYRADRDRNQRHLRLRHPALPSVWLRLGRSPVSMLVARKAARAVGLPHARALIEAVQRDDELGVRYG